MDPKDTKDVPVEETKETKTAETKTEPVKEVKEVVKVSDALKTVKETKEPKMVPEAVLIEYKKEAKEVRKELDALKKSIEEGATKKEVTGTLKEIADEYGVDPEFLSKFATTVQKEAEAKADAKLQPIKDKENAEKFDKLFDSEYEKAIAENPEYSKLVSKDAIKALTLNPRNSDKNLDSKFIQQVFESSYGHLVTGKKTLTPTNPRGGPTEPEIDIAKARSNSEYFKEIMADPDLKKKYNEEMLRTVRF
jgi:hypothetical protein